MRSSRAAACTVVRRVALGALLVTVQLSCTKPPDASGGGGHKVGLGEVMLTVGRHFEVGGRAALANRFELAEFEVGEIVEAFEDDVPGAEMPKEGPTAQIPAMAKGFLVGPLQDLRKAASKKDLAAFKGAYAKTAELCNGCHLSAAKGFVQIPGVPGNAVPDVEPAAQGGIAAVAVKAYTVKTADPQVKPAPKTVDSTS